MTVYCLSPQGLQDVFAEKRAQNSSHNFLPDLAICDLTFHLSLPPLLVFSSLFFFSSPRRHSSFSFPISSSSSVVACLITTLNAILNTTLAYFRGWFGMSPCLFIPAYCTHTHIHTHTHTHARARARARAQPIRFTLPLASFPCSSPLYRPHPSTFSHPHSPTHTSLYSFLLAPTSLTPFILSLSSSNSLINQVLN